MKHITVFLLVGLFLQATAYAGNNTHNLLLLLRPRHVHYTGWGAVSPGPQDRPVRSWLDQFSHVAPVRVTTTLADAVTRCPDTGACVIEVGDIILPGTFYLARSNTKLIGLPGNTMTFADSGGGSFIELESNVHDICIKGLNMDGQSHDYGNKSIFGIMVNGENIRNLAVLHNHIHHFHSDSDAHGIAVYGTGKQQNTVVTNVIIDHNTLNNMRTGSSEVIAVNGNVTHWQVTDNTISHVNNIAIDAIGGEGTSPVRNVNGRILPGTLDAARYGFIENNTVLDMTTRTNPAYGNEHSWGGAIYIDGGHHIRVTGNTVTSAEWGYDIGAENCVKSSHIFMENNHASQSYFGDLYIGGYAAGGFAEHPEIECDPRVSIDDNEGHGYVLNVTIKNNTFTTPSGSAHFVGTIETGNRIRHTIIIHPGFTAQHPNGNVSGDDNSIRTGE